MKRLLRTLFVTAAVILPWGCPAADSVRAGAVATAEPAPKAVAGQYAGGWKGSGSSSGELRIKLKQDAGSWQAEAVFTYEGQEIPTKVKVIEIVGTKVELVFDWVIQGTPGQSKLTGDVSGDSLRGTFESKASSGTSNGTWTVTRKD